MKSNAIRYRLAIGGLLVAAASGSWSNTHPSGALAAGGGTSSGGDYELTGAIPIATQGHSTGDGYYLSSGLAVASDAYVIFDDGMEP